MKTVATSDAWGGTLRWHTAREHPHAFIMLAPERRGCQAAPATQGDCNASINRTLPEIELGWRDRVCSTSRVVQRQEAAPCRCNRPGHPNQIPRWAARVAVRDFAIY